MKDVRDNAFSFLDDWYGRLDDIIEDLNNNGFTVLNATNEFIDVSDENDKEYVLKLGGTEKTITINIADSRNNVTNASTSIDIYKYMQPTVEATVYRDANKQAYIAFTPTIQTTVAGKANSISNFYATSMLGEGITKVETSLETSPQKLNGTDDIAKSYDIYVYLTDAVGGEGSTNLFLPSDIPIIDIGSDGKTVTFFGTSPTTATKESVNICNSIYMTSREISINSDPNDEFTTETQITTHRFSLSDVIELAIDSDGYSFTEASIRIEHVTDSGEIPARDIVLSGDGEQEDE